MKKFLSILLLFCLFTTSIPIYAVEVVNVDEPKWEDYVPEKYKNPKEEKLRFGMFVQVIVGAGMTAMIVPSIWGIPLFCRGVSNFKHVSYSKKKEKFEIGIAEAEKIKDPKEKEIYYKKVLKSCNLKENKRIKREEKEAKKRVQKLERIKKEIQETKI